MLERVTSTLTLQHRVPEYQRRAGLLRQHAIVASITNGICFARIRDGKFYQLDTSLPKNLLTQSAHYERLANSAIKRIINEPYERRLGGTLFAIQESIGGLNATLTMFAIKLEQIDEKMRRVPGGFNS